jgi:hypothetical protein
MDHHIDRRQRLDQKNCQGFGSDFRVNRKQRAKDDKVKTLVFACLTANSAKEVLKDIGIAVGNKLAMNVVKSISGKTLIEINKKVGFKLFTEFGEKGVINLGKAVPLLGGLIGGSFDAYTTNTIGNP